MKRLSLFMIAVAFLAAACGPQVTQPPRTPPPLAPSHTNPPPTSTAVPPVDLSPAQVAAIGMLSDSLGLPLGQIKIVTTEAMEWRDSCLGVDWPGTACLQVITPGYRIVLEANRLQYEYHTNEDGKQVRAATVALTWQREGGIAGFCDTLQVYLSGEVFGSSCNGDYRLGTLTTEEMQQLLRWTEAFGAVAVQTKDQAVADAMTMGLTFNGSGTGQPTEADKTEFFNWAQALYTRLEPCC